MSIIDTTQRTGGTERAVSPVIGVILMVAITVILAAVIGTFVLDLGQDVGDSAPQASLNVDVSAADNTTTIEHKGGEALVAENSRVIVTNGSGGTVEYTSSASATFAVGEEVVIDTNNNTTGLNDFSAWGGNGAWSLSSSSTEFTFTAGTTLTVRVIDTQSQKIVFETDVTA